MTTVIILVMQHKNYLHLNLVQVHSIVAPKPHAFVSLAQESSSMNKIWISLASFGYIFNINIRYSGSINFDWFNSVITFPSNTSTNTYTNLLPEYVFNPVNLSHLSNNNNTAEVVLHRGSNIINHNIFMDYFHFILSHPYLIVVPLAIGLCRLINRDWSYFITFCDNLSISLEKSLKNRFNSIKLEVNNLRDSFINSCKKHVFDPAYYDLRVHFSTVRSKFDRFIENQIELSRNIIAFPYNQYMPFPIVTHRLDHFNGQNILTREVFITFVRESIIHIHGVYRNETEYGIPSLRAILGNFAQYTNSFLVRHANSMRLIEPSLIDIVPSWLGMVDFFNATRADGQWRDVFNLMMTLQEFLLIMLSRLDPDNHEAFRSAVTPPTPHPDLHKVECENCYSAEPHTNADGTKFPRVTHVSPGQNCPKCGSPC